MKKLFGWLFGIYIAFCLFEQMRSLVLYEYANWLEAFCLVFRPLYTLYRKFNFDRFFPKEPKVCVMPADE